MKKHVNIVCLLLGILLAGLAPKSMAQVIPLNLDTSQQNIDRGTQYLEDLYQAIENSPPEDTAENGNKASLRKMLAFWQDRLPRGVGVHNPARSYAQALQTMIPSSCSPTIGDFNGNWVNIGPKHQYQAQGIVYDLYVDPLNSDIIWIGVQDGGLWKTINGGNSWTNVSDGFLPSGAGVESIAVSPFNSDNMFIGTFATGDDSRNYITWYYGAGIWRSVDKGLTWSLESYPTVTDAFTSVRFLTFAPNKLSGGDEMILAVTYDYMGAKQKILQKIGNGPWTDATPTAGMPVNYLISGIEFIHDKPGTFYITTDAAAGAGAYVMEMSYNTTTGALSHVSNVFTNTDQHNFIGSSNPLIAHNYNVAYAGGGKLYIAAAGPFQLEGAWNLLEHNVNTGATTNPLTPVFAMPVVTDQVRYYMRMAVHENNPDVIYFLGIKPFKLCKINGMWQKLYISCSNNSNEYHTDGRVLKIYKSITNTSNPGFDDEVYFGNDGGISLSKGNICKDLNGLNFYTKQVYDVDVSNGGNKRIDASMHNNAYASTFGELSNWQEVSGGDGFDAIYDRRDFNANQKFVTHTNDNWTVATHTNTGIGPSSVPFVQPNKPGVDNPRGFPFPHDFGGDYMYLCNKNAWQSSPSAFNPWTEFTTNGSLDQDFKLQDICKFYAVAPSNHNRQYYCSRTRGLASYDKCFHIYDGGTWLEKTPGFFKTNAHPVTDITVDPQDENRFFISFGGIDWSADHRVYQGIYDPNTEDVAWTDMSSGLPVLPVVSIIYQSGRQDPFVPDDIIYAGTDAGVYRWDKPQGCWVPFNDAPNNGKMPKVLINDLEIDYCKGTLVAASYGRGIWESDLYHIGGVFPGISNEITSNKDWTGDKYITGSILVRNGATLRILGSSVGGGNIPNDAYTTNIYMPKFGVIYVEKGAKLFVEHARITNSCNHWFGIQAFGRDVVGQWIGSNGYDPEHGIVQCSKARIENAEEAITNAGGDANPFGNAGGILKLEGVHFYNNWRSIQFLKFTNTSTGSLLKDMSRVSKCYFDVDQNSRQDFYRHITMWGGRGVELTNNEFYNFQNLGKSHESALETIDASYDLTTGGSPNGGSIIQGFYKGVISNGFNWSTGNIYPIKVENTNFNANEIGLELGAMNYPIIMENKFTIGAKQTPLPGGSGWQYYSLGSLFDRVSNFIYCSNEHEKTIPQIPQSSFQYTAGTEIHSSGENNQKVNRNKYRSLFIGTDVDYTCGDNSNKTGIYFTCNNNENNTGYDYIFQANPIIKKAQVNQYPGFPSFPVGNTFSQNATVKHWEQASGGNAPVDYVHSNLAGEIPTNINSSNIHLVQMPYDFNKCGEDKCGYTVAPKADNLSLLLSDINSLISEFSSKEQSYQNYKALYTQLIDGGNTEMTREEVEQSTSDEAMQIKADLLAKSPYVSQDVLFALAERNSLPQAFLFEILMSNPDATKDERFLDYLQFEKPNPMPSYMIEMIKASWSGATVRSALEDNIANTYSKMSDLRNELVVIYSSSPEFSNEQNLLTWLNKVPTLHNQYEVIEFLLAKKEYQQAEQILNALPAQFKLEGLESESYLVYKELYYFKKSLLENNIEINKLSSSQIQELNTIANSSVPCVARTMARSALCFFYKICFPLEERQIPTPLQSKFKLTASSEKVEKVKAYPNPANDYVVFALENSELNPMISIRISDMTGKQVYSSAISKGSIQHIWDSRKIQSNTYVYVITTQSGEKYTGKITVQK